jgi:hypothetical protein
VYVQFVYCLFVGWGKRFGLFWVFGMRRQAFLGFLGSFGFRLWDFDFVGLDTWVRVRNSPGAPLAQSLGFNPSALACPRMGGSEGWATGIRHFAFVCVSLCEFV